MTPDFDALIFVEQKTTNRQKSIMRHYTWQYWLQIQSRTFEFIPPEFAPREVIFRGEA